MGIYDVQAIAAALTLAKSSKERPVFIHTRTVIGVGTATAGTAKAHHGTLDKEIIARSKELAGLDPDDTHFVP